MAIKIKFLKLREGAVMPERATEGSGAFDLYVPEDTVIPHGRSVIPLGFAMQLPHNYAADVRARSGYSVKGMEGRKIWQKILMIPNLAKIRRNCDVVLGLVDEDYRGEVGVILYNRGRGFIAEYGTRIAQMRITHTTPAEFVEVDSLDDTQRGKGGFGSTNK